tara:strand:+ start:197 stop:994 length:798 start_codon:yes stop_codon:yes gene_type:complete
MQKIEMYCVTNMEISYLNKIPYNLAAVGNGNFSKNYIRCDNKENIYHKEKNYSELTFHYWFWKNILNSTNSEWIGFCQKRRFWIKSESEGENINANNLNDHLLTHLPDKIGGYDSLICKSIPVTGAKKSKLLKRGWRNIIKNPLILIDKNKHTISLHFDMHHGYGNLNRAINILSEDDREDFRTYVKTKNVFNPHIMFISKREVIDKWFKSLFPWLERCEKEFGFNELQGYDKTRLYAYLAERYLSFWFKKYTKYIEQPWVTIEF